jgi:diacylglycerol kinase
VSEPPLLPEHPSEREARRHGFLAGERASFGYALRGIGYAWRTQRHLRIHVGIALAALALAAILRLGTAEWAALLGMIALVLCLEMLNTVVEAVVDLASPDYHPLAKYAKDVSAGAVLVAALAAVALAGVLFLPRLLG